MCVLFFISTTPVVFSLPHGWLLCVVSISMSDSLWCCYLMSAFVCFVQVFCIQPASVEFILLRKHVHVWQVVSVSCGCW